MKKYKPGIGIYIVNIIMAVFCISMFLLSIYYKWNPLIKIAFGINSLMMGYNLINMMFFSSIDIDATNITQNSLGLVISIPINEVQHIMEYPIKELPIIFIRIYSKTKKISISSCTKDYKELLSKIIDASSNNPDIRIDPYILELIKIK